MNACNDTDDVRNSYAVRLRPLESNERVSILTYTRPGNMHGDLAVHVKLEGQTQTYTHKENFSAMGLGHVLYVVAGGRLGGFRREGRDLAEQGVDQPFAAPVDLPLGERPESEHFQPPDERLGELGEQEHVRRAGEEEAPGHSVFVDGLLDGQEQARCALDLVHDDRDLSLYRVPGVSAQPGDRGAAVAAHVLWALLLGGGDAGALAIRMRRQTGAAREQA